VIETPSLRARNSISASSSIPDSSWDEAEALRLALPGATNVALDAPAPEATRTAPSIAACT
jgi:hypothetical protein